MEMTVMIEEEEAFLDTDAELKVWAKKFDLPRNN